MAEATTTRTPAVVLGCFGHGGLAIVRSLGRIGVPVYAVHKDRRCAASVSRYVRELVLWDIHAASPGESVRFLLGLFERIGRRSVLIATSDIGTMFVADNAEKLSEGFIFPVQDRWLVRSLCSKKEMYFLAKRWNVGTPETAFPESMADIERYLESARFPVLVKPMRSGPTAFRMQLVRSAAELLAMCGPIVETSAFDLMLQEYIPGADDKTWVFNGYFDQQGRCLVSYTGKKLRNYPPYFGAGSLGVSADNDDVKRMTIAFMEGIGYRGGLDLGYRFDVRDGRYKVHDINPRIGGMFRCFVGDNGIDIARAIYCDMTGEPVVSSPLQDGRKWIAEDRDFLSAVRYYRDGIMTIGSWLKSIRNVDERSYVASDDPMPFAYMVARTVGTAFDHVGQRLLRHR